MGLGTTNHELNHITQSVTAVGDSLEQACTDLLYISELIHKVDVRASGLNGFGDTVFMLMHLLNLRMQVLCWEQDSRELTGYPNELSVARRGQHIARDAEAIAAIYERL